ncbi:Spo0E family sporulation regulatory protein-aspartic acid phosphatase [Tissierellaceae bacterium HCP3S3_D8]
MNNQTKIEKLTETIEDTRIMLNDLISKRQYNLLDPRIIELSQILDKLLSQYYDLKR